MNLVVIKYCLLIGAILASTAVVTESMNPQTLFSDPGNAKVAADSIYQFGSDAFYKEIEQPGNEYMKTSVEGYSHALLPTSDMDRAFRERWAAAVGIFRTGYDNCTESVYDLAGIPQLSDPQEKAAVCTKIRNGRSEMMRSVDYFSAAKASATPGSSNGFTIGMVIPRIEQIDAEAEDEEIACMEAVIADRNNDAAGFSAGLKNADSHVREMRRIYPELEVLSDDFTTA